MQHNQSHNKKKDQSLIDLIAHPIVKIVGSGLFALVCLFGLSNIGLTMSYYVDVEQSLNNIFMADPLDFTVALTGSSQVDMSGGDQLIVPIMTPSVDSEPVQYMVKAKMTSGSAELCSAIQVLTTAPFPYDGPLLSLTTGTTTDTGSWALTASLPVGSVIPLNTSCTIDLVYTGLNANAEPGHGYTDVEHILLTFFIPDATTTPPVVPPVASGDAAPPSTPVVPPTDTIGSSTPDLPPPADVSATTTPDVVITTIPDAATTTPPTPPAVPTTN